MSSTADAAPSPNALSWLRSRGYRPLRSTALAGDVSPRRYFRVHLEGGDTVIAAFYPPPIADACARFLVTGSLLAEAGVPVPEVLASDCDAGWMLLEDVGPETLFDQRAGGWSRLEPWLRKAANLAGRIAEIDAARVTELSPPLDRDLLERELDKTWQAFLVPSGLTPDVEPGSLVAQALARVVVRLATVPHVVCHRDFMVRNLVPRADGSLVVLDHQDLRLGPSGYDFASLTNDSLFFSRDAITRLLAESHGRVPSLEQVELAALQRTFKAIGTYADFARRGSDRHLPLIPPTLERALALLHRHFPDMPIAGLRRALSRWLSPARGTIC